MPFWTSTTSLLLLLLLSSIHLAFSVLLMPKPCITAYALGVGWVPRPPLSAHFNAARTHSTVIGAHLTDDICINQSISLLANCAQWINSNKEHPD